MSLGVIFFDRDQGIEVLKHERGHNTQLAFMGFLKYLVKIGLPSILMNGDETPWELSASIFGGSTLADGYSTESKEKAISYCFKRLFSPLKIRNVINLLC